LLFTDGNNTAIDIATGSTDVGDVTNLAIRCRWFGNLVQVWVLDRLLIDEELQRVDINSTGSPKEFIDVVYTGSLAWKIDDGSPAIRHIHVHDAALLRVPFTTSSVRSYRQGASTTRTTGKVSNLCSEKSRWGNCWVSFAFRNRARSANEFGDIRSASTSNWKSPV